MSEVRELVDELKDRFTAWRFRQRAEQNLAAYDPADTSTDVPEIEFIPLDPFQKTKPGMPRAFADLTAAWIATQCAPHIFAQGQQLLTRKQVTRVHARGARLTGTTRERHYDDQEILFQDGTLTASCTCRKRAAIAVPALPSANANNRNPLPEPTRTLACPHVVAVLLAYLQMPAPALLNPLQSGSVKRASGKLVCPVTRQPLSPTRTLFQCGHCGLCYSPEGWEFLRKEARGCCCNCQARNTVKEVVSS